jgi:ABC-type uncharacterized transport system substrate-binding protein
MGLSMKMINIIKCTAFSLAFMFTPFSIAAKVLSLSPAGEQFNEILEGLKGDLDGELSFVNLTITKKSNISEIKQALKKHQPNIVVLVGNTSVNLYSKYQATNKGQEFPPGIAVAALFLDQFIAKLTNVTGIAYEIPLVTSMLNVRSVVKNNIKRVGVVHREWMTDFIQTNREFTQAEGIELISIALENKDKNRPKNLRKQLATLLKNDIDALWVINDNNLLNAKTLSKAWLPEIRKAKIPVVVGIESLLTSKINLGSFGIIPDYYGLGVQTASLLIDIMDNDWQIEEISIEQPLSVKKSINLTVLKNNNIAIDAEKISVFDHVID